MNDLETRRVRGDCYHARALVDRLEQSPTAAPAEIAQARKVAYLTIRRARALGVVVPSWRRRDAVVRSSIDGDAAGDLLRLIAEKQDAALNDRRP